MLFLGESLTLIRIVGIALTLLGSIIVLYRRQQFVMTRGVVYALLGSALNGLAITNDAFILRHTTDVFSYTAIAFLLPGIVLLLASLGSIKKIKAHLCSRNLPAFLTLSVFFSIAAVTFYLAYISGGHVSQIATINQFSLVCTVLLAFIFLGERENMPRKIIGAVVAIVGVILIA